MECITTKKTSTNLQNIKYKKLEPISAERLVAELIEFGEEIARNPQAFRVINELSNQRFEYRTANYKKNYQFIIE